MPKSPEKSSVPAPAKRMGTRRALAPPVVTPVESKKLLHNHDPIVSCCKRGEAEKMEELILAQSTKASERTEYVNRRDKNGSSCIFHIAWMGHEKCMEVAIKYGADINMQNSRKNTALHLACERYALYAVDCHALLSCVSTLLRLSFFVELLLIRTSICSTGVVFFLNFCRNHRGLIKLLVERGADPSAVNWQGKMPFDLGDAEKTRELKEWLFKWIEGTHAFLPG